MNAEILVSDAFPEPILPDWTIERLLDWLAEDDARLSDASLRGPLRTLEESLTGTRWTHELDASLVRGRLTREPAIISLVRSIALQTGTHPALRARTLAETMLPGARRDEGQAMAAEAASSSVVATS